MSESAISQCPFFDVSRGTTYPGSVVHEGARPGYSSTSTRQPVNTVSRLAYLLCFLGGGMRLESRNITDLVTQLLCLPRMGRTIFGTFGLLGSFGRLTNLCAMNKVCHRYISLRCSYRQVNHQSSFHRFLTSALSSIRYESHSSSMGVL